MARMLHQNRVQARVVLLVIVLIFLALDVSAASRSKEEMLQDLARNRASARQSRLTAPMDLPALRQQARGVLDNHVAVVADRVAGAVGSFNRRTMAIHERVGATAALRESTRESVRERSEQLNATRRAASPAGHPSIQHVLGRELLEIKLSMPPP